MNIHAYTENQPAPAYISINQTAPGIAKITARTRNEGNTSEIVIDKSEAIRMANNLLAWASKQP